MTATDTGVGKTLFACSLLRAFAARGMTAVGMKPVAAGLERVGKRLQHADVEQLIAAGNVSAPRDLVNPYCLARPIAPHIAADMEGITVDIERMVRCYQELAARADVVVVEGVGGFRVPLGAGTDTAQLAARLALPVVLVVGMRLGCLNHALLTTEAIAARRLKLAGWAANHIEADMEAATENVRALEQRIPAPLIARIAHAAIPDSGTIAPRLDLTPLMQFVDVRRAAEREGRVLNGRTRSVRTRAIKTARKRPF